MSCWTLLGLPATADTRTIKRHYARLLKQTRPDEDPQGFQRLREAYEVALAHKEWEQQHEPAQPVASQAPSDSEPQALSALQRVAVLLKELHVDQLDLRYQQAQEQACAYEFELALLRYCVERPAQAGAVLHWGFEHLHWMSAWQRLDLPEYLVLELQQQLYQQVQAPLVAALQARDETAFLQAYAQRSAHPWLLHLQHRQWFNHWLAQLLADSPYWSVAIFQALCAGQGWRSAADNNCPEVFWPRLLKRHQAPLFLARQRQLASEPPSTPEHRAARLLLAPLSFGQRRAWARHLGSPDWQACHKLAASLAADYPGVAAEMPASNPYFWRDWEHAINSWPMLLGVLLACLVGAAGQYGGPDNSPWEVVGVALVWSLCFCAAGEGLQRLWRPLSQRLWQWDERLSRRLPWRQAPYHSMQLIRDLLPAALLGGLLGGVIHPLATVTYLATLLLVALGRQRRIDPLSAWQRINPWPRRLLLGTALILLVGALATFKWFDERHTAGRYQGLQPWTERLCARMPADVAECAAPATEEQWYPKEPRP
ncbi:J domain-containing protein [Pseudomonas sp. Au-Pse12]|uniref:J domain-containing protein n=1 Tax=Pseudomonas sp. Au-Pse12 TaxID=2906459 RepID=UPI001E40AE8F|nr:J domain-containing protein [Pseudomonas sp. Au-Pse12]MCE4053027.1 J domain-containing protein [Pseudomonas sp. Au-Pse12]